MQGVKRKNLSKACFLCQKAQAACDEQQPCGRCISQGVAHMCFFSDDNKRKFPPNESFKEPLFTAKEPRKPHSNSDEILALILTELRDMREEQRRLHDDVRMLRLQQEKLELRLINHPSSSSPSSSVPPQHNAPNGIHNTHKSNQDGHRYHPYSLSHDHGHGHHHPNGGCPQCAIDEASRVPSPTTSAGLGNLGNHFNIPSPGANINSNMSALTTTGSGLGARGATVNGLVDIMEKLKANGGNRQFGLPTPSGDSEIASKAMATKNNSNNTLIVVFDLTVQPPTVMTATDNFCKVMGYEMHEVVGLPWHKFIHPNNLQRTMNTLNQANMNTSIQFPQLYKTKDGHMFKTLDTHKIFYDGEGRPISDIVSISLLTSKVPYKERTPKPKEASSNALSLYASPLIYSFNSPPSTPSPSSSPVVSNSSMEIPSPSLQEISNVDTLYSNFDQPIIEDLNASSPAPTYMMNYPPSPAPSTPSINSSSSIPSPSPSSCIPPSIPYLSSSSSIPSPSPSPTMLPSHLNPPTHHPAFTIDPASHHLHEQTPLSASTASILSLSSQPPPPPSQSSDSFENHVAMDDEELYRLLIPHEVRNYPLEEWLAQTHISPSPPPPK